LNGRCRFARSPRGAGMTFFAAFVGLFVSAGNPVGSAVVFLMLFVSFVGFLYSE
jgi:hypothetical protein